MNPIDDRMGREPGLPPGSAVSQLLPSGGKKDSGRERVTAVKVCGLTRVEDALECVAAGVDAIGLVFHPGGPRYLDDARAREVCRAIPAAVTAVGVFVNEPFDGIMRRVERCGLAAVQLHGQEPPELLAALRARGMRVIKALFTAGKPALADACQYPASAFLVERGAGAYPGGGGHAWDWREARGLARNFPLLLAGGLSPNNVGQAIRLAAPDAVDVSSGVESAPGRKDPGRVRAFLEAVRRGERRRQTRRIFP